MHHTIVSQPRATDFESTRERAAAQLEARKNIDEYEERKTQEDTGLATNRVVGDDIFDDRDIVEEQRQFDEKYSVVRQFDVRYCITGAVFGAATGTFIGVMYSDDIPNAAQQYIMKTFLYGTILGGFFVGFAMVIYLYFNKSHAFKRAIEARKEALRRREMQMMEVHHEFVYYDAGREHGHCYRLCCCPHYGKITSERVLYSNTNKTRFNLYKPLTWHKFFLQCWNHQVESLDYDFVYDVSVDQKFHEFCTNTGTVIIHIKGNADASTQKEERDRLVAALEHDQNADGNDEEKLYAHEKQLRTALLTSGGIKELEGLVKRARNMAEELNLKRKAIANDAGRQHRQCYGGNADPHQDMRNTAGAIHVLDVHKPYAVLDDLSYKICKQNQLGGYRKKQIEAQLANLAQVRHETAGRPMNDPQIAAPVSRGNIEHEISRVDG